MVFRVMLLMFVWGIMCKQCEGIEYVELSYSIDEKAAYWPSGIPYSRDIVSKGYTAGGFWLEYYFIRLNEHTGTHMDAPSHFAKGKWSIDEIPLNHLIVPGIVIDIQDKVAKDPIAELSTCDVLAWLTEHGPLPDTVILFVRTGWGSRYGNKTAYFGTDTNDTSNLVFPGISNSTAEFLTTHETFNGTKIVGVGIDSPSLDHGPSKDFKTHQILFEANIYGLENVANLDKLPLKGFDVMVMPMKLTGGSGAPTRIVATLIGNNSAPSS